MADTGQVFIAYAREDVRAKTEIEETLRKMGYSTYADSGLQGGDEWRRMLDQHMRAAKAIVVLWSPASARSDEVKHEASTAITLGRYVPLFVRTQVELPEPYKVQHTLTLSSWDRDPVDPDFRKFGARLEHLVGRAPDVDWLRTSYLKRKRSAQRRTLGLFAVPAVLALSFAMLSIFGERLPTLPGPQQQQPSVAPNPLVPAPQPARDFMAEWRLLNSTWATGGFNADVASNHRDVLEFASAQGEGDATFWLGKLAERAGDEPERLLGLFRQADEQGSVLGRYEHALILFRSGAPGDRALACEKLGQVSRVRAYVVAGPAKGVAEHAADMLRHCAR